MGMPSCTPISECTSDSRSPEVRSMPVARWQHQSMKPVIPQSGRSQYRIRLISS